MKVIEFDNFYCVLKEQPAMGVPVPAKELPSKELPKQPDLATCLCSKCQEKANKQTSQNPLHSLQQDAEKFALPDSFLKSASIHGDMELEIMKNAIILTNQTMTVVELINVIESLEEKLHGYYQCLVENFIEDVGEAGCDCEFCELCMDTNGSFPDFMKVMAESRESAEETALDLGSLSEKMVQQLHDMGMCLSEINYAIMEDELIYHGVPKS
ncbi:MAG: hypothetical protein R3Y63_12020 [Eubacteriales bacterium]